MADIYTKQVANTGGEPLRGVQTDTRARQMLKNQGAKQVARAKQIYTNQVRNDMTRQMGDAIAKYGDDPAALGQAFDDIRKGTMSGIADPDVLANFVMEFDLKSSSHIAAARNTFIKRQRAEQKSALNDEFALNIDDLTEGAIGMFENDDDDFKVGYMHARNRAANALKTTSDNGLNVFSDAERKRGNKQISNGALVGLQTFLMDPGADPVRIKQVIKRFNEGAYDGMFNEEDKARAARLLKAAGKAADKAISGGSDKENGDWGWIQAQGIQDEIEDYAKSIKGDTKISYDKLGQIIDLRAQILDQYEKGAIGEKQYKNLMNKSSATALNSIEAYINSSGGNTWFSTEHPTHMGLRAINAVAGDALSGLSADQKLYLYEDFLRRYKAEGGTDERNDEQKNMALSIAKKVAQDFTVATYPAYDPKTSSAIVVGKKVWDFGADRKTVNNKHYQDFEIDDKDDK